MCFACAQPRREAVLTLMIDTLTPEEMRKLLLSGNEEARSQFVKQFEPGVHNFAILMSKAFSQLQTMEDRVPHEMRSAWTYQFLYAAFNCLFSAFHLLCSGLLIPAGNQMRQFGEAVALALLCSHRGINMFERVMKESDRFPAHDALRMVNKGRNRRLLGLDTDGWKSFDELTRFYDEFSHSSIVAVASTSHFATGGRQLGGDYDPAKFDYYNKEVSLSITAAMRLLDTINTTERHLNESNA
jgi:hypothetical protein